MLEKVLELRALHSIQVLKIFIQVDNTVNLSPKNYMRIYLSKSFLVKSFPLTYASSKCSER